MISSPPTRTPPTLGPMTAASNGSTGAGGGGGTTSTGAPGEGPDAGEDPDRAIEEADIIKVDGDRLYALSQFGGLSAIEIGTRDELRLLGRFKTDAMPFEMYLRDNVVLGLFNSYGTYLFDEETQSYTWIQTSRVVALDVSDPEHIEELASFNVPGSISDSRIVGDVLYVIGYEDVGCWDCGDKPATTILSLDISNPLEVKKVDSLRYEDSEYGGMRRSVTTTEDRMYVAGVEYSNNGSLGSTIHVLDISDPSGTIAEKAQAEAEGQITSRWQMDEYDGVLRVISQPPDWDLSKPPVVQTWSVGDDDALTPSAVPRSFSRARSSSRACASTVRAATPSPSSRPIRCSRSTSPTPALPVQKGALEMPGFLYHMEPRGDRLIGLGFDQGNAEGSLTVSLFDVSNLVDAHHARPREFRRRLGLARRGPGSHSQGRSTCSTRSGRSSCRTRATTTTRTASAASTTRAFRSSTTPRRPTISPCAVRRRLAGRLAVASCTTSGCSRCRTSACRASTSPIATRPRRPRA